MRIGYFGKLPSYGDFIHRNVAPELIKYLDNWLMQSLEQAQVQLGQQWKNRFFNSPIWRFTVNGGLFSEHPISGLMMPSIDKCGRCYPFVVVCQAEKAVNVLSWSREIDESHGHAEEFLLSLLESKSPDLDSVNQQLASFYDANLEINALPFVAQPTYTSMEIGAFSDSSTLDFSKVNESFLMHLLTMQQVKLSMWWMAGGVGLQPITRFFSGMPPTDCYSSFLLEAKY